MALAAYRHVLRSTRIAFQDDARMLYAARVEARSRFNNNRSLPVEIMDTQQKINEAEEVARILRQNVVQGQKVEGTGLEDKRYRLRIHNETEKGDNETIKKGTGVAPAGNACCGGASELAHR
ncbi:hypothetical protein JMJ35_009077 [Cladonia borealis]|uniref:Mitochondrial zinc maintenance protein 1, mitochondrial n=1 Tax=Cladonia borealis TaxID=184061 RepID=A0AA39QUS0_9LECA|nr:hypothetical protein JMJ35_009077 [Cladonia borealis]